MALDRVPGPYNLYIGGLISLRRKQALLDAKITHVVSVLRDPVKQDLFAPYRHLRIKLDDLDDEDIVQHFATSNAFIKEGLDGGGGVLVHCAMGKSRSATLVIAFLLAASPEVETAQACLDRIREVREFAEPNDGFMRQLELYHKMGCPVDVSVHPMYQRWLYQNEVQASLACGRAPEQIRFEDGVRNAEERSATEPQAEYRCRKCRRSLATSAYVVPHSPKQVASYPLDVMATPISELVHADSGSTLDPCAHLFVDALSWMKPELEQGKLDGRLECPNERCRSNVGKYAWQGMKCSCGAWVVPGISLSRSKVDEVGARRKLPVVPGKM